MYLTFKLTYIRNEIVANKNKYILAEIYLDTNRKYDPSIPYAQSYDNIAVMFASIVGYDLTVFEDEHQFLQIMNDVIKSFDMVCNKLPVLSNH